jgi:acyl dehydratase
MKTGILGTSGWYYISQNMVDRFAELTGDIQTIHTHEECALSHGFEACLVQGFFLLSLLPKLLRDVMRIEDATKRINAGVSDVRFAQPVLVERSVKGTFTLERAKYLKDTLHTVIGFSIESNEESPTIAVTGTYRGLFYLNL